jgi:hypothetical protein
MLAAKRTVSGAAVVGRVVHVRTVERDGRVMLDGGAAARVAVSCLLRPQSGDRVVLAELPGGPPFVIAILERPGTPSAQLEVAGAQCLTLAAPRVTLTAVEAIEMSSLRDIEITAASGRFSINARHLAVTAVESFIQNARDCIANIGTYALQVRSLLRLHGQQAILTAERDMKIDAEQISVG